MADWIWPEFKQDQEFMPVLVSSKFDKDPIKNESASWETPLQVYGKVFRHSRASICNPEGCGPTWLKFELVRDFMPVLIMCKFDERSDQN